MLPDFQKAKQLMMDKLIKFFEQRVAQYSRGLLPMTPTKLIHEGDGFRMEYSPEFSHESSYKAIHSRLDFKADELIKNPNLVYQYMDSMAADHAIQQTIFVFDSVSEVTEKAGNVIKAKGAVSAEDILELMEKITIDFDTDGNPNMPSIHAGEKIIGELKSVLQEIESSPKLRERLTNIMTRQKSDWNDRENNRKLVG